MKKKLNQYSFFLSKILMRTQLTKVSEQLNIARHKYLKKTLKPILDNVYINCNKNEIGIEKKQNKIIWCFWWQGQDAMPELIKKCYESVKKNAGNRKVILITSKNIDTYSTIPNYIFEKVNEKKISITHLSDILRFNLLKNYGGVWVDLTLYITKNLDCISTNDFFTCSGYDKNRKFNVAEGRWTGFFIGGQQGLEIFNFADSFFNEYWKINDSLIDYFLIDYVLDYAYEKNISNFRETVYANKNIEPNLFLLQPIINDKFKKENWIHLNTNTGVFKLSNRKKINLNDKNNYFNNI